MTLVSLCSRALLVISCLALASTTACKKDPTVNPDDTGAEEGEGQEAGQETGEPEVVYPEQDADPPELAEAMSLYLLGHYDKVLSLCTPLSESLTQDSQIRARGISAALLALATGEDIAENAHAPAQLAMEQAGRLADDELTQLAKIAIASYHMGVSEYVQAQGELESVKDLETPHGDLTMLMWSNAVLGQAFEDDKLKYPEKLDEALTSYQTVFANTTSEVIKARAADGITALGYYKKDKELTCEWAAKADELYEAVGASDYMKEGPKGPAEALRCGS